MRFRLVLLILLILFVFPVPSLAWSTNLPATVVVGQSSFSGHFNDQGGAVSANGLNYPESLAVVGGKLVIGDSSNSRILIYNSIPSANNAAADVVIGQTNMTSASYNQGGAVSQFTNGGTYGMETDGTRLFAMDGGNSRLLIFNSLPTTNNASANVVVGQPDFTTNSSATSATKYNVGSGVGYDPATGKLFSTFFLDNRVLIYNSVPSTNGAAANVVLGQTDFTSGTGGASATKFSGVSCARVINGKLLVCDFNNHRILIYNTIPTTNGAAADVVIGQTNMTNVSANQGGAAGPNTLSFPYDVVYANGQLFVEDDGNNRILIFNGIPTTNNASAVKVLGQPDFTTTTSGASATKLNDPEGGLAYYNNQLFVGDSSNNRVLIFTDDTPPTPTPMPSATPTTAPPSTSSSSSPVVNNPNKHENWSAEVNAGPGFIGEEKYMTNVEAPGAAMFIAKDASHDPLNVSVHHLTFTDLMNEPKPVPFPWSQGFNITGEVYDFKALSAFNGYPIGEFDKPVTIVVPYDPLMLHGKNPRSLRVLYFDTASRKWRVLKSPPVIDYVNHTIATTTKTFSYFVVGYGR